ncbi:MAG TPA: DUF6429 family protein [Gammaproteobacteria bacterium]|nr:DUF6429 family protein [Gammaproteobacteria bacterium]
MTEPIDWDRIDRDRVDDAALALLSLTLHDGDRVWKGLDREVTDRLHDKGYITDPRGKAKSVRLTSEGVARARSALQELFGKGG